jgi:branched-chain amino acid transport system permease protein
MQKHNTSPNIGVDEWAAQAEERRRRQNPLLRGWLATPLALRYGLVLLLLIIAPPLSGLEPVLRLLDITSNEFILRIGAQFLISALLAIGLTVVVGYAGLLDLGYIAFYGVAGYLYAYLSSDFVSAGGLDGLHLPTWLTLPLIVGVTAGLGWALGAIAIRLAGDYLAIVTLGFGQIFVQLMLSATRVQLPWRDKPVDLTAGPNGINNLDNLSLAGYTLQSTLQYYYLFLALLVLVYLAVDRLNRSRTGRGWRALREDELAAEVMGMPTRRLKLTAFALGAAIAALAGVVDAAWQSNVAPDPRYSITTLINVYAMIVLGGIGSLPGAVLGALIFTLLPELLRNPAVAAMLFYSGLLLSLLAWLKLSWRLLALLAGTWSAGFLLNLAVGFLAPSWDAGIPKVGALFNRYVQGWLVLPEHYMMVGNVVTWLALLLLLATVLVKSWARWWLLGATLYALIFAWETRLAAEPSATRILIIGATLVVLMVARPQGLLGRAELKVV